MSEGELLDRIESEINARQPNDFRLSVLRQGVQRDGNWWYVIVQPDRPDVRASRYNAIVREVEDVLEDVLEDEAHENVLLVPALVD